MRFIATRCQVSAASTSLGEPANAVDIAMTRTFVTAFGSAAGTLVALGATTMVITSVALGAVKVVVKQRQVSVCIVGTQHTSTPAQQSQKRHATLCRACLGEKRLTCQVCLGMCGHVCSTQLSPSYNQARLSLIGNHLQHQAHSAGVYAPHVRHPKRFHVSTVWARGRRTQFEGGQNGFPPTKAQRQ